jgi:hypothetical protein
MKANHATVTATGTLQGIRISMTDRLTGYHADTVDAIFGRYLEHLYGK